MSGSPKDAPPRSAPRPAARARPALRQWIDGATEEPLFFDVAQGRLGIYSAPAPSHDDADEAGEDADGGAADEEEELDVEANQDVVAFGDVGQHTILIVADGAGGLPRGGAASAHAVAALAAHLPRRESAVREGLLRGFEDAQRAVLALDGAATTLLAAEVGPGWLRTYHAGDSQAVLVSAGGVVKLETLPHTPSGYGVEAGLLEEDAEAALQQRHLVSNVLGSDSLRVEMYAAMPFEDGDTLILASDGLFDNMSVQDIAALSIAPRLEGATRDLVRRAREAMLGQSLRAKPDDLGLLVLRRE